MKSKSGTVVGIIGFFSLAALLGYIQTTAQGTVVTTIVTAVAGLVATVFSMFASTSVTTTLNKLSEAQISGTTQNMPDIAADIQSRLRTSGAALIVFLIGFVLGEVGGSVMNNWITFSGPRHISGIQENNSTNSLDNLSTEEKLMLLDLKSRLIVRGYRESTIDWIVGNFDKEALTKKSLQKPVLIEELKKLSSMNEDNFKALSDPSKRDPVLTLMLNQTYDKFNEKWKFGSLTSTDLKAIFPGKTE